MTRVYEGRPAAIAIEFWYQLTSREQQAVESGDLSVEDAIILGHDRLPPPPEQAEEGEAPKRRKRQRPVAEVAESDGAPEITALAGALADIDEFTAKNAAEKRAVIENATTTASPDFAAVISGMGSPIAEDPAPETGTQSSPVAAEAVLP